jgi:hypothetical protein
LWRRFTEEDLVAHFLDSRSESLDLLLLLRKLLLNVFLLSSEFRGEVFLLPRNGRSRVITIV